MLVDIIWNLIAKHLQFIKYGMVGSIGLVVHFIVAEIFIKYVNLEPSIAIIIAIVVAALNNYILNYKWSFKDKKDNIKNVYIGYFRYLVFSRGISEGLYYILYNLSYYIFGWDSRVCIIVWQLVTAVIGYRIAVKHVWNKREMEAVGNE